MITFAPVTGMPDISEFCCYLNCSVLQRLEIKLIYAFIRFVLSEYLANYEYMKLSQNSYAESTTLYSIISNTGWFYK